MKIIINENKVKEQGKYSIDDIYRKLDKIFMDKGIFPRDSSGFYIGKDSQNDFAKFGIIMWYLKDCEWFTTNVEKWEWYVDGDVEDLIIHYKLRKVV